MGRSPLSSDKNPSSSFGRRSKRYCMHKNCVRRHDCPGGKRIHLCPSRSDPSSLLTLSEARFRNARFSRARLARPELSEEECALLASSQFAEVYGMSLVIMYLCGAWSCGFKLNYYESPRVRPVTCTSTSSYTGYLFPNSNSIVGIKVNAMHGHVLLRWNYESPVDA